MTQTTTEPAHDSMVYHGFDELLKELGVVDSSAQLLAEGERVHFVPGEFVFREGGQADTLFLIESGRLVLERHPVSGPVEVDSVGTGEVLGWSWLVPPYRWHFDARVLEPTAAVALDGRRLRQRCEEDHDVGYNVLKRFSELIARRLENASVRSTERLPEADIALHGGAGFSTLLGTSEAIRSTRLLLSPAVDSHCPVLMRAETGTGAAQVARAIHYAGPRRAAPFLSVDCAELPECTQEAELFGRQGVAPGPTDAIGLLRLAAGGTLFMDGISHLSPSAQAQLLRRLDENDVEGSSTGCRVIVATHRDLERDVEAGSFSPQLYLRLSVVTAQLPPLRHRIEDIPVLAHHFLSAFAQRTGHSLRGFSAAAVEMLAAHNWPGNVRELKRAVEAAAGHIGEGQSVAPQHLAGLVRPPRGAAERCRDGESLTAAMRRIKRSMIEQALTACGGNRTRAAQRLGMSRPNLQKTMKRLGIR
jgi:DNA-binding NtrC family response regulator